MEYREDCDGIPGQLNFIQTKEKHEIDFLVQQKKKAARLFEVKLSDEGPSKNFSYFSNLFPACEQVQLVKNLTREFTSKNKVQVKSVLQVLENLNFG